MVYCIMQAMMNDEFNRKFKDAQLEDLLQLLKSFDTLNDVGRHKTSYTIFNIRMRKGASIIDHVLYMIK